MTKLAKISIGLLALSAILLAIEIHGYWLSLQPMGCVLCPPIKYSWPSILTPLEALFLGFSGVVKFVDHVQKKAAIRTTENK